MIKRVAYHWTAGPYQMTQADYNHYHFTIGPTGIVQTGRFLLTDNIPPLKPGRYAAHLGGGNSYTAGLAFRGMQGKDPSGKWRSPINRVQFEAGMLHGAKICKVNKITPVPELVFTHYEFGLRNPGTASRGKIDITTLPFDPSIKPGQVGDYIRDKVRWYITKL